MNTLSSYAGVVLCGKKRVEIDQALHCSPTHNDYRAWVWFCYGILVKTFFVGFGTYDKA